MVKTMTHKKYFNSKMWAQDIKKRDSKKCTICGSKKELEAHHIYGISQYPHLTAELNNGITLCKTCHNKYHEQYKDINPITWTHYILNNQNKITNLEINYANGHKEKIQLTINQNRNGKNEEKEKTDDKTIINNPKDNKIKLKT